MSSIELPNGLTASNDQPAGDCRLTALSLEHDDLDAAITALLTSGSCDGLLITRLKKRKLQLKDEIAFAMLSGAGEGQARAS
jgi:hypothetical protein